uniref:Uncharacterized protein n=1 Tax=Cacopsylla melanoneura TaxID=428564 RepID=A0A8D8UJF3_9HEMI
MLKVSVTSMRHTEVHGVRPERWVGQRSSDTRVIQERLLFHHGELVVSSNSEVWSTDTHNTVIGEVSVFLRDDSHTCHFLGPVINCGVTPECFIIIVCDGVNSDFMTFAMCFLDCTVVGVLVIESK